MNAQGEAIARLARRLRLLDESRLKGAKTIDDLGLSASAVAKLVRELGKMRFSCQNCGIELDYDELGSLDRLACNRCSRPLSASGGDRGTKKSGLATSRSRLARVRSIGPYELTSLLGKGACGVVHLARKRGLERDFAVKILTANTFEEPDALARFEREAKIASRLQHPGIVPVIDVGVEEGVHYYVMEYVKGPTLKEHLAKKAPLPPREAARLVAEVARAAAHAHELGIVHRDLKPANVIVDEATGKPRITDFGLARDARDHRVTRTGDVLGTPYYMSPEQFQGEPLDGRTDVWALGVILYEALTKKRPFEAKSAVMLAAEVLTGELQPPSEHVPGTPAELEAIVVKALARAREERYADAAALAQDLEAFVKGGVVEARPETKLARTVRRTKRSIGARHLILPALLLGSAGGALVYAFAARSPAPGPSGSSGGLGPQEAGSTPAPPDAFSDLESLLEAKPALAKAREEIADALSKKGPLTAPAADTWARLLLRNGCYAEALSVLAPFPGNASIARTAAEANAKLGKLEAAAKLVGEGTDLDRARRFLFLRRYDEAVEPALRAAADRPRDARARGTAAIALVHKGDATQAIDHATEARADDPDDPDGEIAWAYAAAALGKLDEADAALDRAFARTNPEPPDPLAFVARGWTAVLRGDSASAKVALERALRVLPDDPEALALLFWAKRGLEEVDAREVPRRAASSQPFEAALDELARRLRGPARFLLAEETRDRLERLAGTDSPARGALRRALFASGEGALPGACDGWWRLARDLAPNDARIATLHARYLVGRDLYERAHDAIEAARRLEGADARELDRLDAERLWRAGHVPDAAALWLKLVASDDPVRAGYARAAYADTGGHLDQARKALAGLAEAHPELPELHRLLSHSVLIVHPTLAVTEKEAATREAEQAFALEGALDLENAFLVDYGKWSRNPVASGTNNAEWRAAYAEMDARYAMRAPETGRYSFYLARIALKFEHSKEGARVHLERASARDGRPWPGIGDVYLHIRASVEKKDRALQEVELASDLIKGLREKDHDLWVPWDLPHRIEEVEKKLPEGVGNPTLPPLPR